MDDATRRRVRNIDSAIPKSKNIDPRVIKAFDAERK
jgi:hypothetical protein